MQYRLLDLVCCPSCKKDLAVTVFAHQEQARVACPIPTRCVHRCAYRELGIGNESDCARCSSIEIAEGQLRCSCGMMFPIIHGVPRFLPVRLQQDLRRRYPDFFLAYCPSSEQHSPRDFCDTNERSKRKTMSSFGYEWTEFADYDANNFLELIHPIEAQFFSGKLGLDAGCGAGRHTQQASGYGAEMVGVDISWAVEAAYERNKLNPRAMIVQSDIFNLPFRGESFDFIYSLGVLHHTPNPPMAFESVARFLKPGGALMVWVYSNKRKLLLFALRMARAVTLRLPLVMVKWLSYAAACIDYGLFIWPYKMLSPTKGVGPLLQKLTPPRVRGYAKYDFRVSYTDWFDRLTYPCVHYYNEDDLRAWYGRGFTAVHTSPTGPFAWRGYGVKTAQ